jgi:hypothetical protein
MNIWFFVDSTASYSPKLQALEQAKKAKTPAFT